ncbi:MAG: folate family ECF transporter S component, partial [Clostridia bacterium]
MTTRAMVTVALLIAISVILTRVFGIMLPVGGVMSLRISFGEIPIYLSGILFGPFAGAAAGAIADLIGVMVAGMDFFPGFTVSAAVAGFIEEHPAACDPTVRGIILGGSRLTAADAFRAMDRLEEYRRGAEAVWRDVDTLLLPTTGTIYRVDEITAEPLALNTNLG